MQIRGMKNKLAENFSTVHNVPLHIKGFQEQMRWQVDSKIAMLDVPPDDEEQEYFDPCMYIDCDCLCTDGNQHG